ncbi:DUF4224 domain-containing protein [Chitinimonas sp.]|uniref:DUF4224 domain-containing protein n=1 Tax=Chitinimonas sp. TaxID=1934313 RepID=UPI0035B432B3
MTERIFLTPDERETLTGIRTGKNGLTREQRQIEWLICNGIRFVVNARGEPIVTIAAIEGRISDSIPTAGWKPRVLDKPTV